MGKTSPNMKGHKAMICEVEIFSKIKYNKKKLTNIKPL